MNNRACTARATFHGVEMALGDAARAYGVNLDTLRGRIERGMAPDEAASKPAQLLVEHSGRLISVAELAKRFGLKTETLRSRIKRGWSVARAIEKSVGVSR